MPEVKIKIYLETTALIDHVLKGWYPELKKIMDSSSYKTTSQYSCMEIKKGFLQNWILLFNKAVQFQSYYKVSQFITNLSKHSANRYYLGACNEAIALFENEYSKSRPIDLIELYGKANEGEIRLEKFKSFLRTQIKRCFYKIQNSTDEIYNPMECFKDIGEPKLENGMFSTKSVKCVSSKTKCKINDFMKDNVEAFQKILEKLEGLHKKDDETTRRITSLKELLKLIRLNRNFDNTKPNQKHCWNISDAILAVIPKSDETIITSNLRHFVPICEAIGKNVKGYTSLID